jgi:integrase
MARRRQQPPLGISIERRGTGYRLRWRERSNLDGEAASCHRSWTVQRGYEQALAVAKSIRKAKDEGRPWVAECDRSKPGLTSLCEAYLSDLRRRGRAHGTLYNLQCSLNVWQKWLDSDDPEELTKAMLADWWDATESFEAQRGRRAEKQRRAMVGAVLGLHEWIYDHDDFGEFVGRPRRIEMPAAEAPFAHPPNLAEVDAMIDQLNQEWHRRYALLLRYTGMRRGEAMQLTWDDVDLSRAVISVRAATSKTRRPRHFPIHPALLSEMAGWGLRQGWVVKPHSAKRMAPTFSFKRAWEAAAVPADLWRQRPINSLRKGFISTLRGPVHLHVIQWMVGQKSAMAINVYSGVPLDDMRAALQHIPDFGCSEPSVPNMFPRTGVVR